MEKVEFFGAGENSGGVTIGPVDLGPLWLFVGLTLLLVLILAVFQLLSSRRPKSSGPDVEVLLSDLKREMNQQNDAVEQKIKQVSEQMKQLEGLTEQLKKTSEVFQTALTVAKEKVSALEAAAKLHDANILEIGGQLPTLRESIGGLRHQVSAYEQRATDAEAKASAAEKAKALAEAAKVEAEFERDAANESAGIEVVPTNDEQYRELHQRLLRDAEVLAAEAASGPVFQFFNEVKAILLSTDQNLQSLAANRLDDRSAYQSLLPNKLDPTLMPFERQSEAFTMKRRLEAIRTYLTAQLKDKGYQILLPVVNSERFSSERHNKEGEVATSNPSLYGMVAAVNAPGWINGNRVGQKAFVTVYVQGTLTPPATPMASSPPPAAVVIPEEAPAAEEKAAGAEAAAPAVDAKPKVQEPLPFAEVAKAAAEQSTETSNEDLTRE